MASRQEPNEEKLHPLLEEAFRAGLDLPDDTTVKSLSYGGHRNWDSLGHMSLIVAIEQAFDVELDEDEVLRIDSYAAAAAMLAARAAVTA
ncbi:acyl carrier protein [Micromonospora chokoriensis]|uniref:acyl carrier protein n=1 Tax=Micromonospora chokoriensis TaxID=356851 RepID=UPI0009FCA8B3|nr:acyl carrier protein [Micromonospora chokoriensis]